jgi:multiple sugar transport system substrate-binding protein
MATLKDVAKDAGVSIATVSCCLSGSRYVKPETRTKIMDSIEKLKYIPNASARDLRSTSTNRIGVVLTDIDNVYHTEIFKGISASLQRKGYTINVAFSNSLPDIEREKIEDFISQNVSGLIIITCQPQNTDFFVNRIRNFGIPTVFLERRPDNLDVNFLGFDNYRTIYSITKTLLENGNRQIALFTGNPAFSSENDCIRGYEDAFRHFNLPVDSSLVCETNMSKEDAFKVSMSSLCDHPAEAIAATSENIAFGVLETLHVLGQKVPEDVQLITLSEESWNSSTKYPGMLHTSRTAFTLGKKAAELLEENIKNPALFEKKTCLLADQVPKIAAAPPVHTPSAQTGNISSSKDGLRILMVDLTTSHSTKLLSASFTRETGIPIEFEFVRLSELLKRISQDVDRSENYFDIYMYDVPWLDYLIQNGFLMDITDFVQSDSFHSENVFEENLENCRHGQSYYGIPIIGGAQIMFYRQDLFENRDIAKAFKKQYQISLRPPKTWTEFNGIAQFFTRKYNPDSPTEFGTSLAGSMDEELAPELLIRLWSNGGKIWDKHFNVCLDTPENAKAFRTILDTLKYTSGSPFETDIQQTVSDFASGKTAMLVTYTEYASEISSYIHKNTIGRVGYRTLPGSSPASIGWNFGLNPFTTRTDAAFRYFQWLCKTKTSYYMTILNGQSPVIAPYHSHELIKLYPWLEYTEESFRYTRKRSMPYRSKSLCIPQNKIERILCSVLKDILQNNRSVEQALASAQTEMELLFKSYGYPRPLHFIK